jgi:hypothetical protein
MWLENVSLFTTRHRTLVISLHSLVITEELRSVLFNGMALPFRGIWTFHNLIWRMPVKALVDQSMEIREWLRMIEGMRHNPNPAQGILSKDLHQLFLYTAEVLGEMTWVLIFPVTDTKLSWTISLNLG